MDTNTQPESRTNAIKKYFGEYFDPYADLVDPQKLSRYLAWVDGYDAGLAARSPRDEEVEKAVEAVERLARAYEAHPPTSEASVEVGQSLRTLLDHV